MENEELADKIASELIIRIPVLNDCPFDTLSEIISEIIDDFQNEQ